MTDASNIILRWEINNATATLATGRAESGVFNEGGFKWNAAVKRSVVPSSYERADFTLRCAVDHDGPWKCEVDAEMHLLHFDGHLYQSCAEQRFCFDGGNSSWERECDYGWNTIVDPNNFNVNDKITAEFRMNIISSERGQSIVDSSFFDAPNRMSNVILKIEEKKLHVSKEYLAVHSPVFETMFFGNFAEKGKEEVELQDVVFEEFLDLLHLIYTNTMRITDRTILHILKLADQFQMQNILNESKTYLIESKGFDVMNKLSIADRYNIITLRDDCLNSFTSSRVLKEKLKSSPEYVNFSKEMKVAICDRIVNL